MRQYAQIERADELGYARFKKEVDRKLTQLIRRVEMLEKRKQRLSQRVSALAKGKKARQRKRIVKHNISPVEKSHLLEVYFANRHDQVALAREGRRLAKTYHLLYDRQVVRWFGIFAKMTTADLKRSLKKKT